MAEFKERLVGLLDKVNISQTELANNIGITRQAISQYCNGGTTPNVETLKKIANYFDVTMDYLGGNSEVVNFTEPSISKLKDQLKLELLEEFKNYLSK